MGLFDVLFAPKEKENAQIASQAFQALTTYKPYFTSWNGALYESELVRSAIDARARHISKLQVEFIGNGQPKLKTRVRKGPNQFQTWGQFLYRLSTILDMESNACIIPIIDKYGNGGKGEVTGYYPVLPSKCAVTEYNGVPYLRYEFKDGKRAAIEFARCGLMTKYQYQDDFFGERSTSALKPTMDLIHMQNQGIEEGVKSAATFRFMARMTNFASPEDLAREQKNFTKNNFQQDASGVLLFPNTYDSIQQVKSTPFTIDAEQMNYIRTNVFNYFGVNEDILQNKAYGDAWSAFYEGAIEPFAIQLSDLLTNMTFTSEEIAYGNCIACTANRLQYMSTADKLQVSAQMADRGILNRDEVRAIWNLPPLPDGQGQAYVIRGEYKNADEVSELEPNEEPVDEVEEEPINENEVEPNGEG